jgi:hypothetical protein
LVIIGVIKPIVLMDILEKNVLKELKYGSKKAFEHVFKTHYDALCTYASMILKDQHQAEEDELSHQEIVDEPGLSLHAVKCLIMNVLKRVRVALKPSSQSVKHSLALEVKTETQIIICV